MSFSQDTILLTGSLISKLACNQEGYALLSTCVITCDFSRELEHELQRETGNLLVSSLCLRSSGSQYALWPPAVQKQRLPDICWNL